MHLKMSEMVAFFPGGDGLTTVYIDLMAWMSNYIPYRIVEVITYPSSVVQLS